MDKIDSQIEKERAKITTSRRKLAALMKRKKDRLRKSTVRIKKRRGRPPEQINLVKVAELAEQMPISDVALRLGVDRSTLYRKGIKRATLTVANC